MGSLSAAAYAPQDVYASSKWLQWRDEYKEKKPYVIVGTVPEDTNITWEVKDYLVRDARGHEHEFDMDVHGFAWRKHESFFGSGTEITKEIIETQYFAACKELLRKELRDVDEVQIIDWRCRKSKSPPAPHTSDKPEDILDRTVRRGVSREIHVDHSEPAVQEHVRRVNDPERAEYLLGGRVRAVNVWRPLNGAIEDSPLAVCDSRSVTRKNMMETMHIHMNHDSKPVYALHDENMKFWYLHGQDNNEALLLKNYDSRPDVAHYVPHGTISPHGLPADAKPRESIEVRCLVYTYPKEP